MSCEILKIKGCEISGSSFSGRKIAFTNREITEDTFFAKVKSYNGTILLEINGFKNLNTVYFSYYEMEDFKPTVYTIEIWADFKDLGTELIAVEEFKISSTPCDCKHTDDAEFTLNFGDEIIDCELSITGSKGAPFTYEDFTLEQINDLKKPAIDASVVALEAAVNANEASDLANEKANLADQSAANANAATMESNAATQNAVEATENANVASNSAIEAAQSANVATGQTVEAINNSNVATQNTVNAIIEANTATQNAIVATQNANNAKGWTPVFQFENDGVTRQVNKLIGYVGGTGNAPTDNIGLYVKENGYTSVKSEASNFKGSPGDLTLAQADARYITLSQKGAANGVSTLDANSQIPNAQIPQRLVNKVIALGGENADTSFTGLYDRNMLALADKEHTVTSVINGSGAFNGGLGLFNSVIFNQKPDFARINGADITTELVVTITFASILDNYSRGLWQPFIQTRLSAGSQFRNCAVEVMDMNNVWYAPSAYTVQNMSLIPQSGLFLFPESSPGTASIKAVRFKLSNASPESGLIYLSNIGFRHVSHSFAPQFPHRGENNKFFGVNDFSLSPVVPTATVANQAVNFGQLASYVSQSSLTSQLANYTTLNGVQTFTNTKTFEQSPIVPSGTLNTHAVNLSQLQQYLRLPSVQLITATTSTIEFDNLLMRITMQNGGTLNASSVLINQEIIISNPSNTTLVINFTSLSLTYTLAAKSVVTFEVLTGNKLLRRSVVESGTLLMN